MLFPEVSFAVYPANSTCEDSGIALTQDSKDPDSPHFYLVADGHGGTHVSAELNTKAIMFFRNEVEEYKANKVAYRKKADEYISSTAHPQVDHADSTDVKNHEVAVLTFMMWRVFNQIDNIALAKSQESADWSWTGATVVAAAFFPGGNKIVSANMGDSYCIAGTSPKVQIPSDINIQTAPIFHRSETLLAVNMSREHNARVGAEAMRIVTQHKAKNAVTWDIEGDEPVARVQSYLQLTRSLGDHYLRSPSVKGYFSKVPQKPFLTNSPFVADVAQAETKFILLATDGLFDHVSPDMAVNMVQTALREGTPRNQIASILVRKAIATASSTNNIHVSQSRSLDPGMRRQVHDDTTVLVVFLEDYSLSSASSQKGMTVNEVPGHGTNFYSKPGEPIAVSFGPLPTQADASDGYVTSEEDSEGSESEKDFSLEDLKTTEKSAPSPLARRKKSDESPKKKAKK